jgi:hypothetical protein
MLKLLAFLLLLGTVAAPIAVGAGNWDRGPGSCRHKRTCQVKAPEIDAGSGLAAIAVLIAGLALAYERRRAA